MDIDIIKLICLLLLCLTPLLFFVNEENNIEDYDISNAALINNFISYSGSGKPYYYLVYQFEDNSIKEFNVTVEQYYKTINIDKIESEDYI